MSSQALLHFKNIKKSFSGNVVLDGVNFEIYPGQVVALAGENGAGKTTLIKTMLGVARPDGGTVRLLGREAEQAKADIGVVLEDCFFYEGLHPRDVGRVLGGVYPTWDGALFESYLNQFGLADKKSIRALSRGMRMKLSLAAALAHRPRLLLLDEATSALDNESEILVSESLEKLAHNRTTLTIAHRLTTVKDYDRIVVLGDDGIEEIGTHEELLLKKGTYYKLWNKIR